ncbi:hypothetical protein CTAYLR_010769, partial [Chrysophaeum taylorii]
MKRKTRLVAEAVNFWWQSVRLVAISVAQSESDLGPVFRRNFRMGIDDFNVLPGMIRHRITTQCVAQARRSDTRGEITPEVRLAATLRFLAGGQVWDITDGYSLSTAEFYDSIWRTIDSINAELATRFPVTEADLSAVEQGFRAKSRNQCFKGCVGAIDGCIFEKQNPGCAVDNAQRYHVPRKDKYGLLAQAFENGCIPGSFFLIGDAAYCCKSWLLSPIPGSHVPGSPEDSFNYVQSALRMNVECAFGMLIRKRGVLWRKLE